MIHVIVTLGVLYIGLYTPYLMATGVCKYKEGVIYTRDKVLSAIPGFNILWASYKYYGNFKFIIVKVVAAAFILLRLILMFFIESRAVILVTIVLFLIGMAMFFIADMVFVFHVIYSSETTGMGKAILFSFLTPLGQFFIGSSMINEYLSNQSKLDADVFK